jgi:hypothetical protein
MTLDAVIIITIPATMVAKVVIVMIVLMVRHLILFCFGFENNCAHLATLGLLFGDHSLA